MTTKTFHFMPSSLLCSCGYIMYYEGVWADQKTATYMCIYDKCEHKGVKYKMPTLELEELPDA